MTTAKERVTGLSTSSHGQQQSLPPILRLSSSVGSLLRSTAQLPSLSSLVIQLAHNAIDAGATQVRIAIHPESCGISCWDDGQGFEAALLVPAAQGKEAEALDRYVTTKAHSSTTYGNKGEALASMAAIGILHIETTLHGSGSYLDGTRWTLLKRGDRLLYSGPADQAASLPSASASAEYLTMTLSRKGTTVTVRDIFSPLPLRRPLLSSRDSLAREVKACAQALTQVSLREHRVSFLLEVASASAGRTTVHLKAPRCDLMLERFAQVRFPVSPALCGTVYAKRRLVAGSKQQEASAPRVVIKGFFLFEGQESRGDQHIYLQGHRLPTGMELSDFWAQIGADQRRAHQQHDGLNRQGGATSGQHGRPLSVSGIHWQRRPAPTLSEEGNVHSLISSTIARGFKASDDHATNLVGKDGPKRYDRKGGGAAQRGSCPAYLFDLWVQVPDTSATGGDGRVVLDEGRIVTALCEEVRDVQRVHGLVSKARKRPSTASEILAGREEERLAAVKRPKTTAFAADWGKQLLPKAFPAMKQAKAQGKEGVRASSTAGAISSNDDTPDVDRQRGDDDAAYTAKDASVPPGFVKYIDSITKRTFFIDERTGNSFPADRPAPGMTAEVTTSPSTHLGERGIPPIAQTPSALVGARRKTLRRTWNTDGAEASEKTPPRWLEETLAEWHNPALPLQRPTPAEGNATDSGINPPIASLPSLLPLLTDSTWEGAAAIPDHIGCDCCSGQMTSHPAGLSASQQTRQERKLPLPHMQMKSGYFKSSVPYTRGNSCGRATLQCDARPFTVRKEQLSGLVRVIGQAAKKFIVCIVDDGAGRRGIICVDQHAADERRRLEGMLGDYAAACEREERRRRGGEEAGERRLGEDGPSHQLKAPLRIWLPEAEAKEVLQSLPPSDITTAETTAASHVEQLSPLAQRLRYWGFAFSRCGDTHGDDSQSKSSEPSLPILVTHVPLAVSDRLRREVATLTAVVRSFTSQTEGQASGLIGGDVDHSSILPPTTTSTSWMSTLRHLPARLLDLFKSRSCRGAIMFNDVLTKEQCERLVGQWTSTDLPLICAHGRRSAVGLCGLAGDGAGGDRRRVVRWEKAGLLGGEVGGARSTGQGGSDHEGSDEATEAKMQDSYGGKG